MPSRPFKMLMVRLFPNGSEIGAPPLTRSGTHAMHSAGRTAGTQAGWRTGTPCKPSAERDRSRNPRKKQHRELTRERAIEFSWHFLSSSRSKANEEQGKSL